VSSKQHVRESQVFLAARLFHSVAGTPPITAPPSNVSSPTLLRPQALALPFHRISRKKPPQMRLAKDQHMVQTLASHGADQPHDGPEIPQS